MARDPQDQPAPPERPAVPRTLSGTELGPPAPSTRPSHDPTLDLVGEGKKGVKVKVSFPVLISLASLLLAMFAFSANFIFATKSELGSVKVDIVQKTSELKTSVNDTNHKLEALHDSVQELKTTGRVTGENIEKIGRRLAVRVKNMPPAEDAGVKLDASAAQGDQ